MLLVPTGIMSALLARDRTGRGQHVEVSLLQGVLSLTTQIWNWTDKGQFLLEKSHPAGVHQATIYECADGEWIHASTMSGVPPTRSEASILGIEEVPMATVMAMSPEERAAARVAAAGSVQALGSEQADRGVARRRARRRGHRRPTRALRSSTAEGDRVRGGGRRPRGRCDHASRRHHLPRRDAREVKGPQPRAGAHTDEVLRSLGHDDDEVASLRAKGVV